MTDRGRAMLYASAALEFVSAPLGAAFLGHYLDLYFDTDPWITMVLLAIGIGVGTYRLVVTLSYLQKNP
jgi:F0F1-type ATP synthase assembly protein I